MFDRVPGDCGSIRVRFASRCDVEEGRARFDGTVGVDGGFAADATVGFLASGFGFGERDFVDEFCPPPAVLLAPTLARVPPAVGLLPPIVGGFALLIGAAVARLKCEQWEYVGGGNV